MTARQSPAVQAPPGQGPAPVRRAARRAAGDAWPPLVALACGWLVLASRVPRGLASAFDPAAFTRWDSGQYLRIASYGYRMRWHCHHGRFTSLPGPHLCANVTWFPGYPLVIRAVSLTGLSLEVSGLIVAWLCWYLTLVMVWLLCAPAAGQPDSNRGKVTRWLCLLLAAVFPGAIYFAALFPISMAALGMLACCYWSARSPNWPLAATAGFVAGVAYLPAMAVVPGLAVAAFAAADRRTRLALGAAAAGVAAGVTAVAAYAQAAVGAWNAYFITERIEYGVKISDPLARIAARFRGFVPLPAVGMHRAAAEQAFLVLLLLALALAGFALCWRAWHSPADLVLVVTAVAVWLIPYAGGGGISVYRAEALCIVAVPLLRRLPPSTLAVPLLAATWVAGALATLFFAGTLI